NFNEAVFKELVSFNKAQIKDSAFFNSATFEDEADFGYAQIGSNAEFTRAFFKESASFNSAKIEGGAFFNPATFEGEANFVHARIGINAEFASTLFKELASFNNSQIEGMAVFDLTTFERKADFINAKIGSAAGFSGAVFKEQTRFYGTQIEGSSFFSQAYLFNWDEILGNDNEKFIEFLKLNYDIGLVTLEIEKSDDGAAIKVTTKKNQIVLILNNEKSKVRITTDNKTDEFIAKTENNKLKIYKLTTFGGVASFTRARFGGDARFNGTIFGNNVSFQDTIFGTIYFGEPEGQFQAKIDLRGCIYNRIHPISFWEQLMDHLDPYDRQPFTQLEETFRLAGKNKDADDVYYMRKRREYDEKTRVWKLVKGLDWFTGYGVHPIRLLLLIAPFIFLGRFIFNLDGAVVLSPSIVMEGQYSGWDAFWVSLNTFLPIEIPSGTNWQPSSLLIPKWWIIPKFMRFTTFATLLSLAGWILVPVVVAGFSGLLKRSK
ncbi:MAG: pentapeptide repeat-containing protein, partial [Candidatus Heimdallarchaeota archaeon]|nr:pentapeptide repeat-containing protein [Candidatus Heimdallarchaeota archaeon]